MKNIFLFYGLLLSILSAPSFARPKVCFDEPFATSFQQRFDERYLELQSKWANYFKGDCANRETFLIFYDTDIDLGADKEGASAASQTLRCKMSAKNEARHDVLNEIALQCKNPDLLEGWYEGNALAEDYCGIDVIDEGPFWFPEYYAARTCEEGFVSTVNSLCKENREKDSRFLATVKRKCHLINS